MSKEKLGLEALYPTPIAGVLNTVLAQHNAKGYVTEGISQRLWIATMCLQGLLSAQNVNNEGVDAEWSVATSLNLADKLLELELKTRTDE